MLGPADLGAALGERATLVQFSTAFCHRAGPPGGCSTRSAGRSPAWPTSRSTPRATSSWSAGWTSGAPRPCWCSTPPARVVRRASGPAAQGRRARRAGGGRRMIVVPAGGTGRAEAWTRLASTGEHGADPSPRSGPAAHCDRALSRFLTDVQSGCPAPSSLSSGAHRHAHRRSPRPSASGASRSADAGPPRRPARPAVRRGRHHRRAGRRRCVTGCLVAARAAGGRVRARRGRPLAVRRALRPSRPAAPRPAGRARGQPAAAVRPEPSASASRASPWPAWRCPPSP